MTPHWGKQFEFEPRDNQIEFAHAALEAGALAVVGSHPHVLQPWEKYVTSDGRETLAVYSLGNFVSGQRKLENRVGIMLGLELARDGSGNTGLSAASYVPLLMKNGRRPYRVIPVDASSAEPEAEAALDLIEEILPAANRVPPPPPHPTILTE